MGATRETEKRGILMYVVGPEGVGKSTLIRNFTKGKLFRKRVEGYRCWAKNVKSREQDNEEIDIYEYRGFQGDISAGPSLIFWNVHVLIVVCTQDTVSEACKKYKFSFWRRANTLVYLVQNIRSSEIRDDRDLQTRGRQFGISNVRQLRVNSKGEVRQLFRMIIDDIHSKYPDFPRCSRDDQPSCTITLDDSGYTSLIRSDHLAQAASNTCGKYKMDSKPRGVCIIINNEDFGDIMTRRSGSDKDEERIRNLFSGLHFDVHVFRNQKRSDLLQILKRESVKDHSGYCCFVCCILSPGAQEVVFGSDGKAVHISEIISFFEGDQCRGLLEKPKIFIIQACQGSKGRSGVDTDGGLCTDVSVCNTLPVDADFLIAYATTYGSLAFRHEQDGSHYISTLVRAIEENRNTSFIDVLTMVNRSMAEKNHVFEGQMNKQVAFYKSTLRYLIVFG